MSQNAWIGAIVAVVVIVGGVWWFTSQPVKAPVVDNSTTETEDTNIMGTTPSDSNPGTQVGVDISVSTAPMSATITYNGDSFSPQEVTIKRGGTVTWKNTSGGSMWVASAQHPTHGVYGGTSRTEHCPNPTGIAFDQCVGGGDYSFTFDKVGAWNYHDHINSNLFGKVNVVE